MFEYCLRIYLAIGGISFLSLLYFIIKKAWRCGLNNASNEYLDMNYGGEGGTPISLFIGIPLMLGTFWPLLILIVIAELKSPK